MNGFKTPASGRRWWAGLLASGASITALIIVAVAMRQGLPTASAQAPGGQKLAPVVTPAPGASRTQAAPASTSARPAARSASSAAPAGAAAATGAAQATGQPKALSVMAVVNGEQITRAELGRECIRRYGEDVLEGMVSRQLLQEACRQRGVQITDQDVSQEIDRIASRFGLARDRWLSLLEEERGFSEEQYRREVVWPMLALRVLAADKIQVSQEEIKKGFEAEFGPKVRARLIAVDSRQKADQLRAQAVANPASFGELSKNHSHDPSVAAAYGVIPPIRRHVGDPQIEAAAFALKPDEISPVIQVANMYYILKCEEQLPQQYISTQHLAEHQKRLADRIRENKMRVAAAEFFEEMQKTAQVVNVYNDQEKKKQHPGVAALINGRPVTLEQLADECIVRHGAEVLDGEINRRIMQQELNRRKQVVEQSDLDAEIARAAEQFGFVAADGSPDVKRWLEHIKQQDGATVELYVLDAVWPSVALKKLVGENVQITPADLQKSFESSYGERVEVLAIVLGDQRQAQKVWEMARANPTDAFFAQLAQQYSIEPASKANGGKVPPIRKHGGSPMIEDEAFKLKAGELSGIVAIENQFIIMRCQGRTKPVEVEMEAVKNELSKDIHEKKLRVAMTEEFDRLRMTAQVDNFLAGTTQAGAAARARAAAGPVAPAAAPAGQSRQGGVVPASATRPPGIQKAQKLR